MSSTCFLPDDILYCTGLKVPVAAEGLRHQIKEAVMVDLLSARTCGSLFVPLAFFPSSYLSKSKLKSLFVGSSPYTQSVIQWRHVVGPPLH